MEAGVCRFGVLGPLVLHRDGKPVPLPSGHQRSLLALFLMAGGVPLSRDRLIDELWGERPPASAVSALHVHLSKLRDLLGELVARDSSGYALRSGEFEVDSWRFDELLGDARANPDRARALVTEALALVRGEPLVDVACEGSIAQWRRALEEKYLHALVLRVDCDLAAGAAAELVAELELLAGEHQFEERLWGQLMLALYRSGRQADALDAFARARRTFASELGLEPGEQLSRLHTQMLERDPSLLLGTSAVGGLAGGVAASGAVPGPARAPAPTPSSNLPRPPTRLIGREPELAVLQSLFTDPDVRLVTLVGPGGVGKTRVEIELARRIESEYRDGAVFVRLERLTDPGLVAAEISTAIGQRDGAEGPGADGLIRYLQARQLLLVLDNFEHLLSAALLVAQILEGAADVRILVSSRTPLRIRGERLFIVQPLALPSADAISASPAVQMFTECALASNPELALDAAATQTVAAICTQLDGLPLALELAASRAQMLTLPQIQEQLSRPLAIGERGLRDLPDRQQTLHATILWSYQLLTDSAREAMRDTGPFLGGFTLEALQAVAGRSVVGDLDELREANLIRPRPGGRFERLELVRAFTLEVLDESGEGDAVRARHRHYFAEFAGPARAALDSGLAFVDAAEPLLVDHANLRAAFADAVQAGDEECAVKLALGLQGVWLAGNLRQEAEETVTRVLDRFTIEPKAELQLLRIVAALEPVVGEWQRRYADRAAEIGDPDDMAIATVQLHAEAIGVDEDEIARLHPILLELLHTATAPRVLGWVNFALYGDAYVERRFDEALVYADAAFASADEISYEYMLACAAEGQLLVRSALAREIDRAELLAVLDRARRIGVHSVGAAALLFVARYAAGIGDASAGRWLALSERMVTEWDTGRSLEDVLRDETMEVLGLTDLTALVAAAPTLDPTAALAEASDWVAQRPDGETSPRDYIAPVRFHKE